MSNKNTPLIESHRPAVGCPVERMVRPEVPTRAAVDALMKRCQIGVGGRHALDNAHSIMADCYGTLGALMLTVERLAAEGAAKDERIAAILKRGREREAYLRSYIPGRF